METSKSKKEAAHMTEQTPGKLLTITHDGKIYVSSYGSLQLGETSLSDIVSEALELIE